MAKLPSQQAPVALITGASRGIGAATAVGLAERGYRLVLAARSAPLLAALAGTLTRAGCPALPVPTDLQQLGQVERLARLALAHFGRVDVLVHNAGVGSPGPIIRTTDQDINQVLTTNLIAPIALTRALLPGMLARRQGSIMFVASIAGSIGLPASAVYSSSKFGLRGFAFALRREVAHQGIGVTVVSPGFIDTDMTRELRWVPKAPPECVAQAIVEAIDCSHREVFVPDYYRFFIWLDRTAPGLLDKVLRYRTRRSR